MPGNLPNATPESPLLLAIDTCGPTGSVGLGQIAKGKLHILGETELPGRTYSSNLVSAISELLRQAQTQLPQLAAIVAVRGPGSFTGVRVGLAAIKGLAESAQIPVVAVSRLEVLAHKAGIPSAALDAHRHEVFLRIAEPQPAGPFGMSDLLAGAPELAALSPPPARIAVCDEAAASLLSAAWPATEIALHAAPTAADALRLALPLISAADFVDLALLDGHYLRRSDAEIFGDPTPVAGQPTHSSQGSSSLGISSPGILVRPMGEADIDQVMDLAQTLRAAPQWPRAAYLAALWPHVSPKRIALVLEEAEPAQVTGFAVASLLAGQAELEIVAVAARSQRRGLARRLLGELIQKFKPHGIAEVILEVRASNHPALQLYRSLGFVETARRARYYADPVEDAVLLSLPVH